MNKAVFLLVALLSQNSFANEHEQFTQQGNVAIKEFATTLKASLVAAMKSGGPIEAISVCNQVAPAISAELSKKYDFDISRTSLKVRNPSNEADPWEKEILFQFDSLKQQGEDIKTLFVSEAITQSGRHEMRMMKAIPTGKVCLTCHGSNIDPVVQAKLNELYPNDQATGFKLGDIRGAFTVRKITY
ncbi:MAG: DUF3365 domain-containing protein [Piscirickettsiaceae bacterium]|nr:DUF3365 domain-containing protein [Piscirickettsiaceae bacterium]